MRVNVPYMPWAEDWCRLSTEFFDTAETCRIVQTPLGPMPGVLVPAPTPSLPECYAEYDVLGEPNSDTMRETCLFDGNTLAASCTSEDQFQEYLRAVNDACCGAKGAGGCKEGMPMLCNNACGVAVAAMASDCTIFVAGLLPEQRNQIQAAEQLCAQEGHR